MKIRNEDTLYGGERKLALDAAVENFKRDSALLDTEYVGMAYDARFAGRSKAIRSKVEEALRAAMPFRNLEDVAAAMKLEALLSRETFEGSEPNGLDATRLSALEAAAIFLAPRTVGDSV